MQALNCHDLACLAILGHTELTMKALRAFAAKTYLYTDMFCPHLNILWNAYVELLKKYKSRYGLSLDRKIISAELTQTVETNMEMPQPLKDKCMLILTKLADGDIPDISAGEKWLEDLIQGTALRTIGARMSAMKGITELQQQLDVYKRVLTDVSDKSDAKDKDRVGVVYNPLADIELLATPSERIPTGLNYLDEISSGGGRAGDAWLILGPPGGGKSVMAVQLGCAQALLGHDVLWATFEQSLEGDLAERMIANITDTSLDLIRDKGFVNLPDDVKDKFRRNTNGYTDRLTGLDMTKLKLDPSDPNDYGGVYSVRKQFNILKEAGRKPTIVIFDWFGAMMSRVAANRGLDLAKCYRFEAQNEINQFLEFIHKEKILGLWFHQLDIKAASARPTYLADATHAQDMHNLQNFFDLVAIIGVRDVNSVCYFSNPKSRKGNRVVRTLRLIGDKSRFELDPGWLPNRDGNFYKPGDAMTGNAAGAAAYTREVD